MDGASKNADYDWFEDKYVPPPSQPTSERYGVGGNHGGLSGRGRGCGRGNYEQPNASQRPDAEVISVPVKDVGSFVQQDHTATDVQPGNAAVIMDAALKNADYEWIEDEYIPPPSQPTSERYGERGNHVALLGRGRGRGNYERPNASRRPDAEVISVPVKDVGRIIGRGGSQVRELQNSSGARIWIKKDDPDNYFEAKFELSGAEEARRKARELIDAIVNPPEEPACSSKSEEPPRPLVDWDKLLAKSDEEAKKRWASLAPII